MMSPPYEVETLSATAVSCSIQIGSIDHEGYSTVLQKFKLSLKLNKNEMVTALHRIIPNSTI